MKKRLILLAGQGIHHKNMFKDLFPQSLLYNKFQKIAGLDIRTQINENNFFNKSANVQSAIFLYHSLHFQNFQFTNQDILIGHSLGQIAALFLAGCFQFQTGLQLVLNRGRLVQNESNKDDDKWGMLVCRSRKQKLQLKIQNGVEIACFNSPRQQVLAGKIRDLQRYRKSTQKDVIKKIIQMPNAFHCSRLKQVVNKFKQYLNGIEYKKPKYRIKSTVDNKYYQEQKIKDNIIQKLSQQLILPVLFYQAIQQFQSIPNHVQKGTQILTKFVKQTYNINHH